MPLPDQRPLDAIVIGGGPGGSCAATYLARARRRVLVLEKEVFPRFHVGESLLPYTQAIFRELGVIPALEAAGFPRKYGARFSLGNGALSTRFDFGQGRFTREPETFQVERSVFDHILLKHARASGAEVREGWTVRRFTTAADSVTVEALSPEGKPEVFRAAFLIDASGRGNLTGNQAGLRVLHPRLKKLAVFGHFTGVERDPDRGAGDTVIVRLADKWFWLIPVSAEKTSVGLVLDQAEFARDPDGAEEVFQRWVEASPVLRQRMQAAQRVGPLQTTTDFSYHNRRLVGQRLLRVGDAAGFMDPIFSAGVYLAMWSGKLAAEAVTRSVVTGDSGGRRLTRYEKRVRSGLAFYWKMGELYYTRPFIELFLQPRDHADLPAAVNAVLAGELEGGWGLRWRLRYFLALVWIHARRPLVPRLPFASMAGRKPSPPPSANP